MHIVYCYQDLYDDIIKYVGITSRKLAQRVAEHKKYDAWVNTSSWKIQYFYVGTKSESESWESHLITKYSTYNWYNVAKKDWGAIGLYKEVYPRWRVYSIDDIVVELDYDKLKMLDDYSDTQLVSETELLLDLDIDKDNLMLLVAKKVIQPIARTSKNELLFWDDAYEKCYEYLKHEF